LHFLFTDIGSLQAFKELAVKAKADATTSTMTVAKIKVYALLSLFMIKRF